MSREENAGAGAPAAQQAPAVESLNEFERLAVAVMFGHAPDRLSAALADPRILAPDEHAMLRKGVEALTRRRKEIVEGKELALDEHAFVSRWLGRWPLLDHARQKTIDAAVRTCLPPARMHERAAEYLRACFIAIHAPLVQPPAKAPPSKAEKRMAELQEDGRLCPNKSCRSPRSRVLQKRETRRERECLGCGHRYWTEEKRLEGK